MIYPRHKQQHTEYNNNEVGAGAGPILGTDISQDHKAQG